MSFLNKEEGKNSFSTPIIHGYVKFRSSIYGRVVFIIAVSSTVLFIAFGFIYRTVNEGYMKSVIRENGNNIGVLVEGALYRAMLENDRPSIQRALDRINNMSGIDDVSMYDQNDNLVYTSIQGDTVTHGNPDCKSCHSDFSQMFSRNEKSYKIIDLNSGCVMKPVEKDQRHLIIKSPILNNASCTVSECHAHTPDEDVLGSLVIRMPLQKLDDALEESTADFFLVAALLTGVLTILLIFFTSKQIRKPLSELVMASEAVAKGDKTTRLEIKPHQLSDMRMVSLAFNEMLDNLHAANTELHNWSQQLEYKVQKKSEELGQAQNELINIERIASLGKLSLSVAHEINNPLSGILVYTKLIQKQMNNTEMDPKRKESLHKHLKLIESETKRCGDIVKGLLDFSRKDQENYENRHLHDILTETCELMTHTMKIANIRFWTEFNAPLDEIYCSPNQIKQAVMAILVNASEAVTENGEIFVRTHNPDPDTVRIDITDNGSGISREDLPHIFEPFFSTKEKTSGIGLGLAIVHGIVQSHKGKISVKSEQGLETTITITLPLMKS